MIADNTKPFLTRRARRNHTHAFESKVAHEAIKGEKILSELAQQFDVHDNQIKQWRDQLLAGAKEVFNRETKSAKPEPTPLTPKPCTPKSAN
ncbi:MAG: transposase [bacterium]|nr:transposase [bacterium]